jgi:anti-sigma B factor antagonist
MAAAGHGADRPAPRPRLARTLNDTLTDMPAARPPGCRAHPRPRPQEVTTMTMTEPRFPVRITRGVPVVIAPDEIDITNAEALRAALLHAAARPGPALVVDMTRTRFCDSAGLHALIGAHKRAQAEGRQVRLAVTGTQVRRILALTALDRLIPVCTSLDQALAHPPAAPSRAARERGR